MNIRGRFILFVLYRVCSAVGSVRPYMYVHILEVVDMAFSLYTSTVGHLSIIVHISLYCNQW